MKHLQNSESVKIEKMILDRVRQIAATNGQRYSSLIAILLREALDARAKKEKR